MLVVIRGRRHASPHERESTDHGAIGSRGTHGLAQRRVRSTDGDLPERRAEDLEQRALLGPIHR
jgi:hypothetical protein